MNSQRKPTVVVNNGLTPSQRAVDPGQYDRQDLSWQREGGEARVVQYWAYLQTCVPLWDKKRVLDVGCGDGWLLSNMLRTGAQSVLGIEPSVNNRNLARARYPKLLVVAHTWETYPMDPDSFDVIVAVLSLNHVADVPAFFRKAQVLLSAGGHIIAVVPDFDYWGQPRRRYEINVQTIDERHYAAAVTRPSGVIADIVRHQSVYREAGENVGLTFIEDRPMPPAEAYLKLAPQYADAAGKAITRLMRFQKA